MDIASRRPSEGRVEESGMVASFSLRLSGCAGQDVPIGLYAVDAAGRETFLATRVARVPSDEAGESAITIFIPLSRLAGVAGIQAWRLYARSPGNEDEYIARDTFTLRESFFPGLIWSWTEWEDRDAASGAEGGFQLRLKLHEHGYKGNRLQSLVILEDSQGNAVKTLDGSPIIVGGSLLNCTLDDGQWDSVEFDIPWRLLGHFDPAFVVYARPGVKLENGEMIGGNLYFKFLAGGGLDQIYERLARKREAGERELRRMEEQLNALKQ